MIFFDKRVERFDQRFRLRGSLGHSISNFLANMAVRQNHGMLPEIDTKSQLSCIICIIVHHDAHSWPIDADRALFPRSTDASSDPSHQTDRIHIFGLNLTGRNAHCSYLFQFRFLVQEISGRRLHSRNL
jgi:hypothetical protein